MASAASSGHPRWPEGRRPKTRAEQPRDGGVPRARGGRGYPGRRGPVAGPRLQRPCLRRRPRPHDGAILIETRDMEGDLRLVREGHRDRLALHGVRTPRTGPDGGRVPRPKPCGLALVSALSTLHERHASQRVSDSGAVWQGADPAHAAVASVALLAAMGGVTPQGTRGMLPDGLGGVRMRQSWPICCSGVRWQNSALHLLEIMSLSMWNILFREMKKGQTCVAQFIGLCSSLKWSRHRTKSPFLALPATAGSNAAYKIISACSNAVS
jgi:hypothetical protein